MRRIQRIFHGARQLSDGARFLPPIWKAGEIGYSAVFHVRDARNCRNPLPKALAEAQSRWSRWRFLSVAT